LPPEQPPPNPELTSEEQEFRSAIVGDPNDFWNILMPNPAQMEIGLTKSAALDYAERGVRVNAVCPGLVNTPLIADMVTENPELHEHLVASHPLGRIAEPEEVADAIVWLATGKSSYVTGVALPVDGGYLAR
jgi:enoyl-[acyl-carrier-protein] reductase (NADH)